MEHLDAKLSMKIVACVDGGVKSKEYGLWRTGLWPVQPGETPGLHLLIQGGGFRWAHVFFHDFQVAIEFDVS